MESFGDSRETVMYVFDKGSSRQIKFQISAEVDEDKLTTRILLRVDEHTLTVVEGEDPCIDFYYKSHQSDSVVDPKLGWMYQLFWSKGEDSDLTYDQMDQGLKAGNYLLQIREKMFHELEPMRPEFEPSIMRQNLVCQKNSCSQTTFYPFFIKGREVLLTVSYHALTKTARMKLGERNQGNEAVQRGYEIDDDKLWPMTLSCSLLDI